MQPPTTLAGSARGTFPSLVIVSLVILGTTGCATVVLEPGFEDRLTEPPPVFETPIAQTVVPRAAALAGGLRAVPQTGVTQQYTASAQRHERMAAQTTGTRSQLHENQAKIDRSTADAAAVLDTGTAALGALSAVGAVLLTQEASEVASTLQAESAAVGTEAPPGSQLRITVDHETATSALRTFWNGFAILFLLGIPPLEGVDDYTVVVQLERLDGSVVESVQKTRVVTYMGWTRDLIIPDGARTRTPTEFDQMLPKLDTASLPPRVWVSLGRSALRQIRETPPN